jgi:hypothetical protein
MGCNDFIKLFTDTSCYYCGAVTGLGFDRINNNDGHHLANVVVSCELCNMTRGNRFNIEEFKQIGLIIERIQETRRIGRA